MLDAPVPLALGAGGGADVKAGGGLNADPNPAGCANEGAAAGTPIPEDPNSSTRSSRGFDVVIALAPVVSVVAANEFVVAPSPPAPSAGPSSKSRRFSDFWPATTVLRAFSLDTSSSRLSKRD